MMAWDMDSDSQGFVHNKTEEPILLPCAVGLIRAGDGEQATSKAFKGLFLRGKDVIWMKKLVFRD